MTSTNQQAPTAYALEARGIAKRFGGTQALVDADLLLRPGTVHALLGGNGSGKSTMIKCLAGVHRADDGEVTLAHTTLAAPLITPAFAHHHGLRVVHQDLGLFDRLSIAENFALGSSFPTRPGGSVDWRTLHRRVAGLLEQYDLQARPTDPVGSLRPAQKTMVAIARTLQDQQGSEHVLLLDEPTASLPDHESHELLASLRTRAELGQTIVLVSHRLPEVLSVADEITVFRDGRVAGALSEPARDEHQLVSLIAGPQSAASSTPARPRTSDQTARASEAESELLRLTDISAGRLNGLNLSVRAGEIVGVAGLLGSGRTTLLDVVFGAVPVKAGSVTLDGTALPSGAIGAAMARGVAMVPEHRLRDAAFSAMDVRENLSAAALRCYWRGWMRRGAERNDSRTLVRRYAVKTADVETPLSHLSGGNQQKVMLARWLRRDPRLLLLDEPTQGVDVVARAEIYHHIQGAAARGCGVLVASSDHNELVLLCDRVVVLADGRIAATVTADDMTSDRITQLVQSPHGQPDKPSAPSPFLKEDR